jgi:hypothetical protein
VTAERSAALAKLREPFPESAVDKLPKGIDKEAPKSRCDVCGGFHSPAQVHLDYVGHAAVTERLLDADPSWMWEPVAWTNDGRPLLDVDDKGRPVGLWIKLTVAGVTRLGYGTVEAAKTEPTKELIGDAIRNAAMRFGVALDLWKKHSDADAASVSTRGRQVAGGGARTGGGLASKAQIGKIHVTSKRRELATEVVRRLAYAKWRDSDGHFSKLDRAQASEFIDFLDKSSDEDLDAAVQRVAGVRLPEEPPAEGAG